MIMALSISFSVILYQVSSEELGRGFSVNTGPGQQFFTNFDAFEQVRLQQVAESNARLARNLVLINFATLAIGGGASYLLARRTLKPIQDAMDAQNRFTSDASHELRTPLAVMQTEVEVALRNQKLSKTEARSQLKSVLEEVNKLRTLSDRLLQLANGKELDMSPTAIDDVATEAVNRMIAAAQTKKISVQNTVGPQKVNGNAGSLTDLLAILIDNAIKYSPSNTTIRIASKATDGHVTLTVADQGIGIKAGEMPYIFDRFYRADSSRSKQNVPGHGLGLSIAKHITDLHKGTISATSTPGKGTIFKIVLPNLSVPSQKA